MNIAAADLTLFPVINFAMQQNHVPIVRRLVIENTGTTDWQQVQISLSFEPGIATGWQQQLDGLPKGGKWEAVNIWINLSAQALAALTERISGSLQLCITADEAILFQQYYPIDLLAYDQWNGAAVLPEMAAAFITPNHPAIPQLIRQAAVLLEKWTGSSSFDGYQRRNPDQVLRQMAAIYEAIAGLELIYCAAPASFEDSGQRIRLADALFTHRLANCLDLSLFYAACLEAVGLRPIIALVKGHAFTGAWLVEASFADAVNDDPSLLSKRMAEGINEIAMVEATGMSKGSGSSFTEARANAGRHLVDPEQFHLFLDVQRARRGGIRPIPIRTATATGWEITEAPVKERSGEAPPELAAGTPLAAGTQGKVTKQQLWERKLLDLTLRNNLLNLRLTRSNLQFMTVNLARLEDALAQGNTFQLLPQPSDWAHPLRQTGLYQAVHATDPVAELVNDELVQHRLRTHLAQPELDATLINLYRSSRLALEENGANTLYMALGFLKWFETASSERPLYAPILLVPAELIRKPGQRGYVLRSREEDTMLNITLLEKLRQDFGIHMPGLEQLPRDESGIDVRAVFNLLRKGVMEQRRWDVEEEAVLGTFSFSKFILWNDIHHNTDTIREHQIVASLLSGKLEWQPDAETDTGNPDTTIRPAQLALPIPIDSSQLAAILASGAGKSFVLHGPPGTGKSQTITNIIANALYAGKTVLFVAAKKAALDVVERRLDAIGLAPFCLELHSNKAKKSAVLEQLRLATEVAKKPAPEHFETASERLFHLRNDLNRYVAALHRQQSFGFSLYDAISRYSQLATGADTVTFSPTTLAALTSSSLTCWNDLVADLEAAGKLIGSPHGHPLQEITVQQYSQRLREEATALLQEYHTLLQDLVTMTPKVTAVLKIDQPVQERRQTALLATLAAAALHLPDTPPELLRINAPEQTLLQIGTVAAHGKKSTAIRAGLLQQFTSGILQLDAAALLSGWNRASAKWFLPRWLGQRKIIGQLLPFAKTGSIGKAEVITALRELLAYREEQSLVDQATYLPAATGYLWNNGTPDWNGLETISQELILFNRVAAAITGPEAAGTWRLHLSAAFSEGSRLYFATHTGLLETFGQLNRRATLLEAELKRLLGIEAPGAGSGNWLTHAIDRSGRWLQHLEGLKNWTAWTAIKEKAVAAGLPALVERYENGQIPIEEMDLQYRKGLYRSAADYIIEQEPQLAAFRGMLFEEKIRQFKALSREFELLTQAELYARLAAKVPSATQEASQSSEMGILQKNLRNGGRATSIRRLFDSIPNLLPRLTPCMLMSPISVAQYFDAGSTRFDLVIFDEASQMPTCEAVGAIARGTSLIVVGDPKQMPPTSFFSTNQIDEENMEQEDLESILEDCLALSMPSKHLLWHYRSKHESLIAFSNANYYDHQLLTFPSTDDILTKVTAVHVPGYYDKGKTRQNLSEAHAIVAEVIRRLSDPQLRQRSIGIVTFSAVQQNLIEDLLNEEWIQAPHLEKIAVESPEPLFIKNLENVQGDERDVILFSICYGPDEAGKISLNFGPLNRNGGWRRLNVAVSRARYEMKVFATLRSGQIDLARSSSKGLTGLKDFLAYAEKGKAALPLRHVPAGSTGSSLEDTIAEALRQEGYEVHTRIGTSAYKIDIGIVDPVARDRYLLGILCDGPVYGAAITARDRELVQPGVLTTLGWQLHRIWSVEWWENPEAVLQGLLAAIEQAGNTRPAVVSEEAFPVQLPPPAEPFYQKATQDPPATTIPETISTPYQACLLQPVKNASAEAFLLPVNKPVVLRQMKEVLHMEAPVSKALLYRRVLAAWGAPRMGTRLAAYLDNLLSQLHLLQTAHNEAVYLWKITQEPAQYTGYRLPAGDGQKREAEDLPPEETANAIRAILQQQISLPRPDLVREAARQFGFARLGGHVERAMQAGIELAAAKGLVNIGNGRIVLAS